MSSRRAVAPAPVGWLAAILLVSGFCSLVYQVVWLRLLRLVFGASTASSAAVLAIFMGGLGLGGWILGRRVDRSSRPLTFYSRVEMGIAVTAALTPPLVELIRWTYIQLGGTPTLGSLPGTALRLGLSALVLGLPAFLMGGTLPAAVRAVERVGDRGRRAVGLFYGVNTLGAVLGALWATFVSIELLGLRRSLWLAALINLLLAVSARALARRSEGEAVREPDEADAQEPEPATSLAQAPPAAPEPLAPRSRSRLRLVLAAAFLVGFVFFLMELVWYRMLAPILGGSSYTFGLILAVALAGIGLGGVIYSLGARERRPTLNTFAGTCALLAFAVAFPFVLGDRVAFLALGIRDLGQAGLLHMVLGWALVTALVVLPAALVAGYQFPVLVGLLGAGRREVGREVGLAYAWNTAGAILGSVAGGFGLLPLLGAPGAWRWSVVLLAGLALAYLAVARLAVARVAVDDPGMAGMAPRHATGSEGNRRKRGPRLVLPALTAVAAVALILIGGPTAAWRHSGIGGGRLEMPRQGPNGVRAAFRLPQADLVWEEEGVESSVALIDAEDYAFYINGKSDGSALGDAPNMVMSGLVGAILHPRPRQALVIGLGTGTTAGWLADVPEMRRVDVVELEPAVERVARMSAPVNRGVLDNPVTHLVFGDAREHLLTTDHRYDIIFSQPSNPYRAGISSLFTHELYRAVAQRLEPQGIFLQWFQGYEVDNAVIRTAYATLLSVFPHVETWWVQRGDLLLVAALEAPDHDPVRLRRRVSREPFARGLQLTWGVSGLEGFYSGYLAGPELARRIAAEPGLELNTDDHPVIEFGFVRNLGRHGLFSVEELSRLSLTAGTHRPPVPAEALDWERVRELASARGPHIGASPRPVDTSDLDRPAQRRINARLAYSKGDHRGAVHQWSLQTEEPACRADLLLLAHSLARLGDPRAPVYIERLADLSPAEAEATRALWLAARGQSELAFESLRSTLETLHTDPWVYRPLVAHILEAASAHGRRVPEQGRALFEALSEPFAVGLLERLRLRARLDLAVGAGFRSLCLEAFEPLEPHPFWERPVLMQRLLCYQVHDHPLRSRAQKDVATFLDAEALPLYVEPPQSLAEELP